MPLILSLDSMRQEG